MNVRVLGVEMRHGSPFERSAEVGLYLCHEIACQPLQVHAVAELGR
jgi:hypothetical protein